MNNPNCGACGMLNSRGFCSLTACRFPVVNGLGTWQKRILANKPKQTNADRIRAMTDEELAQFFHDSVACDDCPVGDSKCKRAFALCKNTALAWLKSQVGVQDG